MLTKIVNQFLNKYCHHFEIAGYTVESVKDSPTISILKMASKNYFLIFSFFNELPCRLLVDIKSNQMEVKETHKNIIINEQLSFLPFNAYKHEVLDNIHKKIGEKLGIYENILPSNIVYESYSNHNFYNVRLNERNFKVAAGMHKAMSGHQSLIWNNYSINVNCDGSIFYYTKTYHAFDNDYFVFRNDDDIYHYCGVNYLEADLEELFFKIIINKINTDIVAHTDIDLLGQPEPIVLKAIELYKMIKI